MKAPSPLRLISSFALHSLSFPLRGLLQWRQQTVLSKRRTVWVQMDVSMRSTWEIQGEGFNGLEKIAQNPAIKTIVFDVRSWPVGWAKMADFHQRLKDIKSAGKSIFVLLQTADARALAVFPARIESGFKPVWRCFGLGSVADTHFIKVCWTDLECMRILRLRGHLKVSEKCTPVQSHRTPIVCK